VGSTSDSQRNQPPRIQPTGCSGSKVLQALTVLLEPLIADEASSLFIVYVFDHCQMAKDRPGPARDRLLVARLSSVAQRHARWGALTEAETPAAVAELREIAGGRADLLAEVAGVALGTAESKGDEYRARAEAVAGLCRLAGADQDAIPRWTEEGRRRVEAVRHPPFSRPRRTPPLSTAAQTDHNPNGPQQGQSAFLAIA
jgi:hypothetical protein